MAAALVALLPGVARADGPALDVPAATVKLWTICIERPSAVSTML